MVRFREIYVVLNTQNFAKFSFFYAKFWENISFFNVDAF